MKYKRESKEKNLSRVREIEKSLENPLSLIPQCLDDSIFCPLSSYRKKLSGIKEREDLEKLSRSKDEFLRGIGETFRAIKDEEISFSGLLKTPHGSATFYKKGDTDQYVLAGIQNSGNDIFRMLAFSRDVLSGKLTIYSAGDYYKGSCKRSAPERDFIEKALSEERILFHTNQSGELCTGQGEESFTLNIFNIPMVRIYSGSKTSTVLAILKHILTQDPEKMLSYSFENLNGYMSKKERDIFHRYVSGELRDSEFIDEIMKERIKNARISGKYIIGKNVYGGIDEFLSEIPVDQDVKDLFKKTWKQGEGIYIETPTARKFLEAVWDDVGETIIAGMFPHVNPEELHSLKGNPAEIIEKARKMEEVEKIRKSLDLKPWSQPSAYLYDLAVAFRHGGMDEVMEKIQASRLTDQDSMAVQHAFISILGKGDSSSWMVSSDGKLKGEMLVPYVKVILNGTPDEAKKAFVETAKFLR